MLLNYRKLNIKQVIYSQYEVDLILIKYLQSFYDIAEQGYKYSVIMRYTDNCDLC